jgi:CRP-like cAMP-binding protein
MSSLGYGKGPSGITVAEMSFTITCQMMGACLYAAIFGNIAQLIAKLDASGARYRTQRDKIDEFVSFHELPDELTAKLHAYCKFLFAVNRGFDVGQISGALPPNLQHQLLLHLHAPLVKSVPMFAECSDAFIKGIVLQLRPQVCRARTLCSPPSDRWHAACSRRVHVWQVLLGGDAAFKAGETGTEMYFIMRGEMRMMDESLTVCYNALYSGAYFGELAMLTDQQRTATALAVSDCVLFYINQRDFNHVARNWPRALVTILTKAKERVQRIKNPNSQKLAKELEQKLKEVPTDEVGLVQLDDPSSYVRRNTHTPPLRGMCNDETNDLSSFNQKCSQSTRRRTRFCENANSIATSLSNECGSGEPRKATSESDGENGERHDGDAEGKDFTADTLALILRRLTEQGEQIAALKALCAKKGDEGDERSSSLGRPSEGLSA